MQFMHNFISILKPF